MRLAISPWATLAMALLLPAAALAQEEVVEEAPEIRRYTVEIVVFSYAQSVSAGTEVFPRDRLPVASDAIVYGEQETSVENEPTVNDDDENTHQVDRGLVLLKRDEYSMRDVFSHLKRLDAYQPILHVGWTQATAPRELTEALPLHTFGQPPAGLEGEFTLYLGRFLHLVVDLALDAPGSKNAALIVDEFVDDFVDERPQSYSDARLRYDDSSDFVEGPVRYRISEDRIVKNGDIRYFDHPKFGVIAKITRVEEDDSESESSRLFSRSRQ